MIVSTVVTRHSISGGEEGKGVSLWVMWRYGKTDLLRDVVFVVWRKVEAWFTCVSMYGNWKFHKSLIEFNDNLIEWGGRRKCIQIIWSWNTQAWIIQEHFLLLTLILLLSWWNISFRLKVFSCYHWNWRDRRKRFETQTLTQKNV